ncbi:GSCOCG00006180001-RA-CDS, partial [Cotesia congregata]
MRHIKRCLTIFAFILGHILKKINEIPDSCMTAQI